jgi:F0F1-type ATP synthase membrane subunit b/b'
MSWFSVLKGLEEYSFYLDQIEKTEKLLEKLYEDIEEAAIKMNKETGLLIEYARNIIEQIQRPTILDAEKTLEELKEKLKETMG